MRVVILVPRREGITDRDKNWEVCRAWWLHYFPEWPIYEGHHDVGLFNRSWAINKAAADAGDWDVAVIIDADVYLDDPGKLYSAVAKAAETGRMILPFETRRELDVTGKEYRKFEDSVSSIVVVSRELWDKVGGFDPGFVGWGCEDNAFDIACQTMAGAPYIRLPGTLWHLFHRGAPEGLNTSPSYRANYGRYLIYNAALGSSAAIRRAREIPAIEFTEPGIPRIFHRIVIGPEPAEAAAWWKRLGDLHPDWRMMTHRDPQPHEWPMTADLWGKTENPAQLSDILRIEALIKWGGIYVDWDVEPYRSFEPLRPLSAFSVWQDPETIAFGIIGGEPGHPAWREVLKQMLTSLRHPVKDRETGIGFMLDVGVRTVTRALRSRDDVTLLPPGAFYPYSYNEKHRRYEDFKTTSPWAFAAHHWWASWLPEDQRNLPGPLGHPGPNASAPALLRWQRAQARAGG